MNRLFQKNVRSAVQVGILGALGAAVLGGAVLVSTSSEVHAKDKGGIRNYKAAICADGRVYAGAQK
jgi:hypothetical protein